MKPAGSFPILTNKDSMRKPGVLTKGNPKCSCSFCEIGQLNGVQHILFNKEIRDKPGRPATATKENDLSGRVLKKVLICYENNLSPLV